MINSLFCYPIVNVYLYIGLGSIHRNKINKEAKELKHYARND